MRPLVALLALAAFLVLAPVADAHMRACLQPDGSVLDRGGHGKPGPTGATGSCPDEDLVEFVVGWSDEPPFAGVKNGLDLQLRAPADDAPVANATLEARYTFGGQSFPLEVRPQFGRPGAFTGEILPTRPGVYTLHVTGTVETTAGPREVNFTIEPAQVEPLADIAFPEEPAAEESPETAQLRARVAALESRLQDLERSADEKRAPGPALAAAAVGLGLAAALRRRQP